MASIPKLFNAFFFVLPFFFFFFFKFISSYVQPGDFFFLFLKNVYVPERSNFLDTEWQVNAD